MLAAIGLVAPVGSAAAATSAYVANDNSANVSQYDVSAGGALSAKTPPTAMAGSGPFGLAISPDGKSVYVVNSTSSGSVSQYDVGAGGLLAAKTPATVAAGNLAEAIAVSPDGKSVYVTNYNDNDVSQYDVGASGALTAKSSPTVLTGSQPQGVAVSPDGQSVYVTNAADDTVSQFDVGTGGVLSAKSSPTVGTGSRPLGIAVSPDGKSVYVTNGMDTTVSQFDVGAGGLLSAKTPATVPAGQNPAAVAVSPDGKSVYVTVTGVNLSLAGTVAQYDVGAGGALTVKSGGTVGTGPGPLGITLSPDGKSVYVTNSRGSGTVSQYDVGSDGSLSFKTPGSVASGSGPIGVALLPEQGPAAAFSAAPVTAGSASTFDGSSSSDPDGSVVAYAWDFGDGHTQTTTAPTAQHVYASAGGYTVRLTVSDDAGCSTAFVFTGQTAYCSGTAAATTTRAVAIAQPPPPVCYDRSVSTGVAKTISLSCTGQVASRAVGSQPRHGTLSAINQAAGTVLYTPRPGYRGPDSFTFNATGAGGTSNTAAISITVTSPPPLLRKLHLRPAAFRAATPANKRNHKRAGGKVSYTDSQKATTRFTVDSIKPGVLVRKRCVAATKRNSRGKQVKRCTRFIPVGHFRHTDRAGNNSLVFSGLLNGHPLAPNRYRLDAIAKNANGASQIARALFRIIA